MLYRYLVSFQCFHAACALTIAAAQGMEFGGQRRADGEITSVPQSHSEGMDPDLASNMTYNAQHCTTWIGIMGMRHDTDNNSLLNLAHARFAHLE